MLFTYNYVNRGQRVEITEIFFQRFSFVSSIPIKVLCVFVCWFVCWFVCFLSATRHLSTLRRCLRERGRKHAQREHARACRTTSQRKNRCADAFQKQNRTRAHAVVYVTAEIFKKRGKENQHATSQVQFTVCLLLECLLFQSY